MNPSVNKEDVQYFDCDFDAMEWILECQWKELPPITNEDEVNEASQWDAFFHTHKGGQFFKARKYIYPAYQKWIDKSKVCLEVGCGHGCSIYPLIGQLHDLRIVASDYSSEALSILMSHQKFDASRISVRVWDITEPYVMSKDFPLAQEEVSAVVTSADMIAPDSPVDSILCLFALSALHERSHVSALQHMWDLLQPGGVVLFRDYGICDMTMFRHKSRLTDNLYRRSDCTLAYYFDIEYMKHLCSVVGFDPVELKYATVQITNKKKGITMKRVFIHAVLVKILK